MNKKLLSIVLAILMLFTIVPLAISGADVKAVKIVETGKPYTTFKEAFSDVQDGQTIQFLDNIEEAGYGNIKNESFSRLKDCTISIDFNGYYYAEKGQRWLSFDNTTGFTINLKNGTLKAYESNADLRGFVCLRSGCTYNFTNMVIDCSPKGKNYGGGTVAMAIVADATVNFRNCTITDNGVGTPAGGLVYYNAWTNATVNYYNTNVKSYTALFNNKGTTLYSGTFEAVGSLNIGTYTVAATSTATTAESKKVVVECNHNYTDGVCDYCGVDANVSSSTTAAATTTAATTTAATTIAPTTAPTTTAATTTIAPTTTAATTTIAPTTAPTTVAATTAATTASGASKKFVFLYSNNSSDFTINTNGHAYNYINDYNGIGMQLSGLVAGQTLTFTTKESLDSGIYSPTLYCRSYSGRAKVNVYINDILAATELDTSLLDGTHKPFALDSVTIANAGPVTIKFVTTSSGSFFPDDIVFEKTGDADPFNVSVSMLKGASIRLSNTNGIRFYTKVDTSKIESLIADGYAVEMGTLIAPADLLGNNELTLETSNVKMLNVAYEAKDSSGNFIYYENGDTFVGSIYDIKEESTSWSASSGNITRDFVARGYVKVSKDGVEKVNYADYYNNDVQNNSRSLQYVANAYKNDGNSNYAYLEETYKGFVDKWASAVK